MHKQREMFLYTCSSQFGDYNFKQFPMKVSSLEFLYDFSVKRLSDSDPIAGKIPPGKLKYSLMIWLSPSQRHRRDCYARRLVQYCTMLYTGRKSNVNDNGACIACSCLATQSWQHILGNAAYVLRTHFSITVVDTLSVVSYNL